MDGRFYRDAANYWSRIPATVDGVLGGFGFISDIDINASRRFLESILSDTKRSCPGRSRALDCGAGIGRISKHLLTHFFDKVDLIEQNPCFLEEAKKFIDNDERVGTLYATGLQNFTPDEKYDVIWCQWVLGHLRDADLIKFLTDCKGALAENGLIIIKENVTSSNLVEKDDVDSSITRPLDQLLSIIKKSKLKRIKEFKQTNFPKGLYPVYMFALRPKKEKTLVQNSKSTEDEICDNSAETINRLSENMKSIVVTKKDEAYVKTGN